MNAYLSLLVFSVGFLLQTESVTEYGKTKESNDPKEPLALIRRNNLLKLAEPIAEADLVVYYPYDPAKGEEFLIVCANKADTKDNHLYENLTVNDKQQEFPECEDFPRPSIRKTKNLNCFDDTNVKKGVEYAVGYWVRNDRIMHSKHLAIYKICYSEKEGTLYTALTVNEWKNLLFRNLDILHNLISFKSNLGSSFRKEVKKNPNVKPYQLVCWYDLPIESWRYTTLYNANMVLVPDEETLKMMTDIDNYIRISIRLMKPGTVEVYAGSFKSTRDGVDQAKTKIQENLIKINSVHVNNEEMITPSSPTKKFLKNLSKKLSLPLWKTLHRSSRRENKPTEYTFIWKILQHESEGAIAIITQIDPSDECFEICPNISAETNWIIFESGGEKEPCVYACEIDGVINAMFGLSSLGKISNRFQSSITSDEMKSHELQEDIVDVLMNEDSGSDSEDYK